MKKISFRRDLHFRHHRENGERVLIPRHLFELQTVSCGRYNPHEFGSDILDCLEIWISMDFNSNPNLIIKSQNQLRSSKPMNIAICCIMIHTFFQPPLTPHCHFLTLLHCPRHKKEELIDCENTIHVLQVQSPFAVTFISV